MDGSFFAWLPAAPLLLQWLGVGIVAFVAAVLGGLAGYGTGLILPIALAPVIGVAHVIPVMAVAMMINNFSRVLAFRRDIQWPHVRRMLWLGLPTCDRRLLRARDGTWRAAGGESSVRNRKEQRPE